jgi:ABC-2 type transport system ATP-binding protein
VIALEQLNFGYGRTPVFRELSLDLRAGGITGLLGKNGVGKTTLLKLISGLRFSQSGRCRVMGRASAERPAALLQELFFLPEAFSLPALRIGTYLKRCAPFYPCFEVSRFHQYLEDFEVPTDASLTNLSFGQKKKFMLAFGLATNCRLLLLDEPTNGLDIPSKSRLRQMLAAFWAEDRLAIIATHQAREVQHIIDAVIILQEGNVIFNHPLERVAARIAIEVQPVVPDSSEALLVQAIPGGFAVVTANREGDEIDLDLEILFNTVTANPQLMNDLCAPEEYHD